MMMKGLKMRTEDEIIKQIEIYYKVYNEFIDEHNWKLADLYRISIKELIYVLGYDYEEADSILKNPLRVYKLIIENKKE